MPTWRKLSLQPEIDFSGFVDSTLISLLAQLNYIATSSLLHPIYFTFLPIIIRAFK